MNAAVQPNPSMQPYLSVNNIEVIYDHVILVLKGVSLEVAEGRIVALLGANGAGRSMRQRGKKQEPTMSSRPLATRGGDFDCLNR